MCAGASCCESRYEKGEGVLKNQKGCEKGHCHAGERTDCGPSRSWIREMLHSETLRRFYRASGFPQETSPAAEAAITSCSDAISSSAKVGDGESGRDNIYYNHLYTYNWNP